MASPGGALQAEHGLPLSVKRGHKSSHPPADTSRSVPARFGKPPPSSASHRAVRARPVPPTPSERNSPSEGWAPDLASLPGSNRLQPADNLPPAGPTRSLPPHGASGRPRTRQRGPGLIDGRPSIPPPNTPGPPLTAGPPPAILAVPGAPRLPQLPPPASWLPAPGAGRGRALRARAAAVRTGCFPAASPGVLCPSRQQQEGSAESGVAAILTYKVLTRGINLAVTPPLTTGGAQRTSRSSTEF